MSNSMLNWLALYCCYWLLLWLAMGKGLLAAPSSPICTFESPSVCSRWSFMNSEDLLLQQQAMMHPHENHTVAPTSANNFYIVLSGGGNASNHYAYYQALMPSNLGGQTSSRQRTTTSASSLDSPLVAMLVTPHFERTLPQCELHFRYRVLGERGAELLVATEQLSLRLLHPEMHQPQMGGAPMEEEDEDWTRPTLRARFEPGNPPLSAGEPWAQARVTLGQFNFPTRIRVECHPSSNEQHVKDGSADPMVNVECSVDDLQLVNCAEEEWRAPNEDGDCPEGRIPCRPFGGKPQQQICLRSDQLCDMHPDCADGEDELEQLHRCSQVPEGARCDFEDLRWLPAGCAHWRFFSSQAGGQPGNQTSGSGQQQRGGTPTVQHLVSLADAQTRRPGIPPSEYFYAGRFYRPGHFLFFSSYDHAQSGEHDIVYSFAMSPPLPAFQNGQSPLRQCSLRFFYCQTGFSPFQVFLQRRDKPNELAKLWAPPRDEHTREPCEWRRAAVDVDVGGLAAGGEYSVKLSFAKLAGSLGSVALDDLVLSPECFANGARSSLLPTNLFITVEELLREQEKQYEKDEKQQEDLLRWIVPSTGEYRLELAGSSGGTYPGKSPHSRETWADHLITNLRLNAGQQIGVRLGHSGQCVCDAHFEGQQLRRDQAELREQLCSAAGRELLLQQELLDILTLPGCGGGGASMLLIGQNPVAIAAGGGGDFPVRTILIDSEEQSAANGGKGLSLAEHIGQQQNGKPKLHCQEPCIDGHFGANLTQLLGGKCQAGSRWALQGGKGGGGAACGPGGGGGAGYQGGTPGFLGTGQPGTSLTSSGQSLILPRANAGQGFLRLFACPQRECPSRSNCTFGAPLADEEKPEPKCICPDGRAVPPNGSCQIEPSLLTRLFGNNGLQRSAEPVPTLLLLSCLLLFLLTTLLTILCCFQLVRCCRRRQKLRGCPSADVHELIAIAAETRGPAAGEGPVRHYGISGNPIYESLNLNPLPQIPRSALRIEKIIGHGAFGEVYEGWLLLGTSQNSIENCSAENGQNLSQMCGGQKQVKVAVKSLPVESARDFGDDFEMEARLLSQFKHENIVTFFGVSFEQQPKYIVLEFLEGGDLKNFLRENRPRQDQESTLKMGDLMGFALDVARACEHLEATRFVHRDIAARNCLLTAKVGRRVVKIADFGMARDIYRNDYYRKGGKAFLPVRWMPPESFLDGLFTSKTDVWAFGVLLWEIFSMGYIPYSGRENHEVMRLVVAGDRLDPPIGVPAEVYELMLCCWNTEAERRPKFAELITAFETLMRREDLINEPLPPIRHRLANERSVSGTPSMSRAGDPHPASTTSQVTVSTVLSSSIGGCGGGASSTTTSTYESMPTAGDGVCRAVFPPYQSRQPEENNLMHLDGPRQKDEQCSSSSSSSQDETLHESAGTVKLRNCIRRPPPLALKPICTIATSPSVQQQRPAMVQIPTAIPSVAGQVSLVFPQHPQFKHPSLGQNSADVSPAQWRRPSNAAATASPTVSSTNPAANKLRNHSLPPLLPFGGNEQQRGEFDRDSGIASARSISSADAALTLMSAALAENEQRQRHPAGSGNK